MKPCPFCGGNNIKYESADVAGWCRCHECRAISPLVFSNDAKMREVQAEAMWNERK
jgi:hypothetical protein